MLNNPQSSFLDGTVGKIEVRLNEPGCKQDTKRFKGQKNANKWVVICHPHPKFGGTMDNKVVTTMEKAFQQMGYGTVMFNFRGVGASEGEYDQGEGESHDLQLIVDWLLQNYQVDEWILAGFSFGTYVSLLSQHVLSPNAMCLIAPPVNLYDFSQFDLLDTPTLVIQGGLDEVVPAEEVRDWIIQQQQGGGGNLDVFWRGSASHYFHKQLIWLRECIFLNY